MAGFIEIDYSGLQRLADSFRRAPQITIEELEAAMIEADAFLEREVADSPEMLHANASGLLRGSMFHREEVSESTVIGLVASSSNYAEPVELGTRPHFPPVEPLIDWVKIKLGIPEAEARSVAFLVARKIARTGTKGAFMFQNTAERQESAVRQIFEAATARISARIEGGQA